jgi:hypothetical protein
LRFTVSENKSLSIPEFYNGCRYDSGVVRICAANSDGFSSRHIDIAIAWACIGIFGNYHRIAIVTG